MKGDSCITGIECIIYIRLYIIYGFHDFIYLVLIPVQLKKNRIPYFISILCLFEGRALQKNAEKVIKSN